ncbi:hypothetical protein ACJVC5_13125 [Peredibacter sp. HCB2-198]|uniref:hypothetical protein n=1 Tax=Peredibacter sp. HCB2-198 TaxID=3383025 RepID=UPI0038B444DD
MRISFLLLFLVACSGHDKDPLKNTKKLVKDGHTSLYQNGAFKVPYTKIKLVPPGPEPLELAKELSGTRAKASFLKYISEASEASVVIWDGTKKSYKFSKKLDEDLDRELSKIGPSMRKSSKVILSKSFATGRSLIGGSWNEARDIYRESVDVGKIIKKDFQKASEEFVKSFVIIPKKQTNNAPGVSFNDFVQNFEKSNEYRKKLSDPMAYLISDSVQNYSKNIRQSFNNSQEDFSNADPTTGHTLASLKAAIWVLKGVVFDGVIMPVGKISAGAIGYTFANGIAYPVLLFSTNGATSTQYAVEVIGHSAGNFYEVVAPSLQTGLAAIIGTGIKTTGSIVGNSVQYIGAPIAASGTVIAGSVSGAALGIGGGVLAGASMAGSGVMTVSSEVLPKTISTMTLVGGVTAYTIKGTAEVAYEVGMATAVPTGQVLGGGLTLSYGLLSHLSAHTVLAVADASYLVLSMEGPKWVIYAVKGVVSGGDYAQGTVLDLEKMKKNGEEFYKVPASDEEIKKIVEELTAS